MERFEIAPEVVDDGTPSGLTMWRAEVRDDLGRLTDATRLTSSPRQAHADGELLVAGRYWANDSQPSYSHAA